MSEEVVVLNVFSNEVEAGIAQQVLQAAGVNAFVFKDDGGGWSPIFSARTEFVWL